jgi:4-alpha-glucanotransferase
VELTRAGGVLLHPTSLPSPHGIGDLGPAAVSWLSWLEAAGCRLWQVLPLGPTGYGNSPYQGLSALAGNPLLISFERLAEEGLLSADDLADLPSFAEGEVEYGEVIPLRERLLDTTYKRFHGGAASQLRAPFESFRQSERDWLDDHALFVALKDGHGGAPWTAWDLPLAKRDPDALQAAAARLGSEVEAQRFRQFLFRRQWSAVRELAAEKGITLIGDLPMFVAHDSVDVWAHPELFQLDEAGNPAVRAGVPPDYFSPTGQLWGNPLYRWEAMRQDGYAWWVRRFRVMLEMVDVMRLDHFRGLEACWEVPGDAENAEHGRWVPGPGADFLEAARDALGSLPMIAEDLGVITREVTALRDRFDLPGMRVLQFGFEGGPDDAFLPHNYPALCVAYTGTHDNDTALGWYRAAKESHRGYCRRYLAVEEPDIAWGMIRACWASVAAWALAPLQDVLGLDSRARMNLPSRPTGNWGWRFHREALSPELAERLAELGAIYGRVTAPADV